MNWAVPENTEIGNMWESYKRNGATKIRNLLVVHYLPLVSKQAYNLAQRSRLINQDDLYSEGVIGLVDAIEKYDLARKTKFKMFAYFKIRFAMFDSMRLLDWAPRRLRIKEKNGETGLGIRKIVYESSLYGGNVDNNIELDDVYTCQTDDFNGNISKKETKETILKNLTPRQKLIIELYYYQGLTMQDIGKAIGVSAATVCTDNRCIVKLLDKDEIKKALMEVCDDG